MKIALRMLLALSTALAWSHNPPGPTNPAADTQKTNPNGSATVPGAKENPATSPSAVANSIAVEKQAEQDAAEEQTLPEYCLGQDAQLNTDSVADQISLYYFNDVSRLMSLLNPKTRKVRADPKAVQEGKAKQRALLQAELELTKQQSEVNRLQADLQEKLERFRQSEAHFSLSQALLDSASAIQTRATQDQSRASDRLSKAQKNADAHPGDDGATSNLTNAKLAKDKADQQLEEANKKQTRAQSERDAVQAQITSDRNDQSGLASKIEEAKKDLEKAQQSVADQRGAMLLAAADEMDSFTRTRDSAAYWCAPGEKSDDPARQVTLFAFDDSKTIFLRGPSEDVQAVEHIIAQFDRPAPQARLSLWTLELNSDATKRGTDKLNETLQIVEEELADTRVRLAGSVSALRDAVLEEVNKPRALSNAQAPQPPANAFERRVALYDNELLTDLRHFNQSLPDPAVVTTLGESLVALTLADKYRRASILINFRKRLLQQFGELRVSASQLAATEKRPVPELTDVAFERIRGHNDSGSPFQLKVDLAGLLFRASANQISKDDSANLDDFRRVFPATMRALGLVQREGNSSDSTSGTAGTSSIVGRSVATPPTAPPSPQLAELKQAFTRLLIGRQLDRLSTHLAEADSYEPGTKSSSASNLSPEAAERRRKRLHTVAITRLAVALNFFQKTLSVQLSDACGLKLEPISEDFLKKAQQVDKDGEAAEEVIHQRAAIAIACLKDLYPAKFQSAREAAANEMLKQMIVAFEDDLDRHFIRPMINRIRTRVNRSKGISVGVVQRTSLLATNRLLARVDPRGSAQLGLGQDQDILGAVTQLAQLYAQEQTLGPLGMLPALQALPRKPGPELYAVNTGAEFKVTPIFDPSGQALRFQLDYIAANRVQEPTGTKDPQLSRIERHTINTEVQLSNMELREVTRFEADAALGIPTRKTGGIPLLNEIPGIKEVPLIGYFVRRAGHNAVMQESIIFGQTTTYPTISDLLGLEVGSDSGGETTGSNAPATRTADSNPRSEPSIGVATAVATTASSAAAPHSSGTLESKKPQPH